LSKRTEEAVSNPLDEAGGFCKEGLVRKFRNPYPKSFGKCRRVAELAQTFRKRSPFNSKVTKNS